MVNVGIFHTWSLWERQPFWGEKLTFFLIFSTWSKPPPKKPHIDGQVRCESGTLKKRQQKESCRCPVLFLREFLPLVWIPFWQSVARLKIPVLQTWQHWSYLQFSSQICEYFWTRSILEQPPCFVPWTPLGADKKATVLCSNFHTATFCSNLPDTKSSSVLKIWEIS